MPTDVSCDEWAFSLLPLDVDLLSMELPEFFRDYFLVNGGPLGLGIVDGRGQAGVQWAGNTDVLSSDSHDCV